MSGAQKIAISAAIGGTAEALGGGKFSNNKTIDICYGSETDQKVSYFYNIPITHINQESTFRYTPNTTHSGVKPEPFEW
jgi:hypothetical protein